MSLNGVVVVGEYKGRPVSLIQDHPYWDRDGHMVVKRRYEYADNLKENGKPEKDFVWPPGTKLTDLRVFGCEDLKRLEPGEPIFVVEGEKTVDALAKRGFIAVSLPASIMRDLSALDELLEYPGNPIIVNPDNDKTGFRSASAAHEHLKRRHPRVRWLAPVSEGPGGDFADFLAPFGRDEDKEARAAVLALVERAVDGPPQPTVAEVPEKPKTSTLTLVRLWEHDEPPPRTWLLPGLLPSGCTTILYGDSAMKKSYLCAHLAFALASGVDFLGMKSGRVTGKSIWIDVELDQDEHERRMYAIARHYGADRPPEGLYYVRPRRGLLHQDTMDEVTDMIEQVRPDLVILDSFTKALSGGDVFIPNQVTSTMEAIEDWGASLLIDHIKNVPMGTSQGDLGPFGTAFKRHLARSLIQVVPASGGGMSLVHKKSNFGPEHAPIYYEVTFDPYLDNPTRLHKVGLNLLRADDPQMAGIEDNLPSNTLTNRVLINTPVFPATASPRDIGAAVNAPADSVSAILSKLQKKGLVVNAERGLWHRPRLVPLQSDDDETAEDR